MEPGFNPALEQQAIGRVHHLGQTREVEIVRLLVKDSIETRIQVYLNKKYGKAEADMDGDTEKKADIGVVGNIATDEPKSKIMADEFDILFGVCEDGVLPNAGVSS